jgi:hypothetical protein
MLKQDPFPQQSCNKNKVEGSIKDKFRLRLSRHGSSSRERFLSIMVTSRRVPLMTTTEVYNMILVLEKTCTPARQTRNESHCLSITVHEKSPVERFSPPRH